MNALLARADSLFDHRPLRMFLWCVAALFAYGGMVHVANMLGFGGFDWRSAPLHWRAFDVVFAVLDATAVAGIMRRRGWGILAFVIAASLQLVLYGAVPEHFAADAAQAAAIQGLLYLNLFLLTVFAMLVGIRTLNA